MGHGRPLGTDGRRSFLGRLPPWLFALFLLSGTVKDTPLLDVLPVDLTAVTALGVLLVVVHRLLRPGVRIPASIGVLLLLWCTFVPGVFGGAGSSPYADQKIAYLFGLTLFAAVGAVVVLTGEREVVWFAQALVVVAVAVAVASVVFPDARDLESGKYAVAGSTTIAVARAAGAAALVCLVAVRTRRLGVLVGSALAVGFVGSMLFTGSRGPVLALVAAVAVVVVATPSGRDRLVRAGLFVLAVVTAAASALVAAGGQFAVQRALQLGEEPAADSTAVRRQLVVDSVDAILRHPLGVGWGDLGRHLSTPVAAGPDGAQYAHNVLLEVTAESGWLAGLALLAAIGVAGRALARHTSSFAGLLVCALLVFHGINALVSGTVNDNRALVAMIAVGLAVRCRDVVLAAPAWHDDPSTSPSTTDEAPPSGTGRQHRRRPPRPEGEHEPSRLPPRAR